MVKQQNLPEITCVQGQTRFLLWKKVSHILGIAARFRVSRSTPRVSTPGNYRLSDHFRLVKHTSFLQVGAGSEKQTVIVDWELLQLV